MDAARRRDQRSYEEQERLDRQMAELLQELRVAMPGVPNAFERNVYFVTLIAAAVATALLIAPSAYHRLVFGQGTSRTSSAWAPPSCSAAWPRSRWP
jgi:Family of unknown function (DUF6328)